jgi:predicted GTPase
MLERQTSQTIAHFLLDFLCKQSVSGGQRSPRAVLLVLTDIDQLKPAVEWNPPYDIEAPMSAKAKTIRDAIDSVARSLDFPLHAVVPVAMQPGREAYNLDTLWARMIPELREAKLVQLDRHGLAVQRLA